MANAQGLYKKTVFARQGSLGTPATTGGTIVRRTSSVFNKTRDKYQSNEIVSHQQSTGDVAGVIKTAGKLEGLLSPGTFASQISAVLRRDYAAVTPITSASITIAGSGPTYTVTRGAGSFLTDGIKIGHVVRLSVGTFNAANASKNLLVEGVTATVLTVRPVNGVALVAEGPIASSTVTVTGKTTYVPTTGHTNIYWTVEECYSDLSKFEQYVDVKVGQADIALPATGNATISLDCPGLSQTKSTSATITSPASETTTGVLTAVQGIIEVNGAVTSVTGLTMSITGNVQPGAPEVGSNGITDHIRGEVAVSGSFAAKFSSTTMQTLYDNQTVVTLVVVATTDGTAAADFISITLPAIKIFGDAPDDGEAKEIIRTYPFTAQYNAAGGAGIATEQTILQIQDSAAP